MNTIAFNSSQTGPKINLQAEKKINIRLKPTMLLSCMDWSLCSFFRPNNMFYFILFLLVNFFQKKNSNEKKTFKHFFKVKSHHHTTTNNVCWKFQQLVVFNRKEISPKSIDQMMMMMKISDHHRIDNINTKTQTKYKQPSWKPFAYEFPLMKIPTIIGKLCK